MIIDVGPKTADVTLSWENLYSYNRKFLDPKTNRYFLVLNPILLTVKFLPRIFEANLKLHPQNPDIGFRTYKIRPEGNQNQVSFWIDKNDVKNSSKDKIFRLMELFNFRIDQINDNDIKASYVSESYKEAKKLRSKFIHWIYQNANIPCVVIMPDASINNGFAESACKNLKPDTIIQFERFGFVRIDQNEGKLVTYYSHK